MDVRDRRMQVQLTQEARIASDFSYIRAILAVVGFVSALGGANIRAAFLKAFFAARMDTAENPFLLYRSSFITNPVISFG